MATQYLLKTTNTDNTINTTQIGDASITGAKLTSNVDLPVGARLDGVALTDRITAAAGGYDFKEAARTVVLAPSSAFIGGPMGGYNDSASVYTETNSPNVPAYGFVLSETSYALNTAIAANGNLALNSGDRVVFVLTSSGSPVAGKPNGIFVASRVNGQGITGGDYFWSFARATDADSTAELSLGALVYLSAGDLAGRSLFLGAGEFNSSSALWTLQESGVYTAGDYINIADNEISVKIAGSGSALHDDGSGNLDVYLASGSAITNAGSGLDVQSASASNRGTVSSDEWGVVTGAGQYGKNYDISNTAVTRTTDLTAKTFVSPYGTLAVNKSALVEVTVVSRSVTIDGSADVTGTCIQKWAFTLARGASGDTTILDSFQIFKSGTSNILGCTVEMVTATKAGADVIAVYGVDGAGASTTTIDHNVSIVCRTL